MNQPFYNTISLSGQELKQAVCNAKKLEQKILLIYRNTGNAYGPSKVHELILKTGKNIPITSVRRGITNLTTEGKLIKTDDMVKGQYGKQEHRWRWSGR